MEIIYEISESDQSELRTGIKEWKQGRGSFFIVGLPEMVKMVYARTYQTPTLVHESRVAVGMYFTRLGFPTIDSRHALIIL